MRDPITYVLAVFLGWLALGSAFSLAAPTAARGPWARAFRVGWAVVVAGVVAAGIAFVVQDPYGVKLRVDYALLILCLIVVLPSGAAAWTATVRARRDPLGPLWVDVLLAIFTYLAVFGLGFVAAVIPDLMSIIGV